MRAFQKCVLCLGALVGWAAAVRDFKEIEEGVIASGVVDFSEALNDCEGAAPCFSLAQLDDALSQGASIANAVDNNMTAAELIGVVHRQHVLNMELGKELVRIKSKLIAASRGTNAEDVNMSSIVEFDASSSRAHHHAERQVVGDRPSFLWIMIIFASVLITLASSWSLKQLDGSENVIECEDGIKDGNVLACASWHIEDALQGKFCESGYPSGDGCAEIRRRLFEVYYLNAVFLRALILLLVLCFFEPPVWCHKYAKEHAWHFMDGSSMCRSPHHTKMELGGLPIVPLGYSLILEGLLLVCVCSCLAREFFLKTMCPEGYATLRREHLPVVMIVAGIAVADYFIYVLGMTSPFRVAHLARLMMLWAWPRARAVTQAAVKVVGQISNLFLIMAATIVFFAWIITIIIDDLRDLRDFRLPGADDLGSTYFQGFAESSYSLTVIMTSSNFPDMMVPMFSKFRLMGAVLILYMVFNFVFFSQLTLAVVYEQYGNSMNEDHKTWQKNRLKSSHAAYAMLEEDSGAGRGIRIETFKNLVNVLLESPVIQKYHKKENTLILWAALDEDGSGHLHKHEFVLLCEDLGYKYKLVESASYVMKATGYDFNGVRGFIEHANYKYFMGSILALNAVFIIWQSWLDLHGEEFGWLEHVELLFSVIYVLDVLAHLTITSFANYWVNPSHRFDLVSSLLLFAFSVVAYCVNMGEYSAFKRYLNILRMVRLVLLLENIPTFTLMYRCIKHILIVSGNAVTLLLMLLFAFASVGVMAFGGKLYQGNPELVGSDFLDEEIPWTALNFNDPILAIVTLFGSIVCNFSTQHADAIGRISPFYAIGPIYCTCFLTVVCYIGFNIFNAKLIDNFIALKEIESNPRKGFESDVKTITPERRSSLQRMREQEQKDGRILHVIMTGEMLESRTRAAAFEDDGDDDEDADDSNASDDKKV